MKPVLNTVLFVVLLVGTSHVVLSQTFVSNNTDVKTNITTLFARDPLTESAKLLFR